MNCEECRHHLLEYLYGELDEQVRKGVEHALSECDDCKRELAALREMLAAADQFNKLPQAEPSARMSQNIMREARIRAMEKTERAKSPLWLAWAGPAFGLALALIAVVVGVRATSTSDRANMEEAPVATAATGVSATTAVVTEPGVEQPAEEETAEGEVAAMAPDELEPVDQAVADSRYDQQQAPVGSPVPDSTVRAENRDSLTNAVPAAPRAQSAEVAQNRPAEARPDRARDQGSVAMDDADGATARGIGGLIQDNESGGFAGGADSTGSAGSDGTVTTALEGRVAAPPEPEPARRASAEAESESLSTGTGRSRPAPRRSRSESAAQTSSAQPAAPYQLPEAEPAAAGPRQPAPAPTPAPAPPAREAMDLAVMEESQADSDLSPGADTYGQRNVAPSADDGPAGGYAAERDNQAFATEPTEAATVDAVETGAITVASLLEAGDVSAAVRRSDELLAQSRSATNIYWAARARLDDGDDVSARLLADELHTQFPQDARYDDLRERIASPSIPATRSRTRMQDSTFR